MIRSKLGRDPSKKPDGIKNDSVKLKTNHSHDTVGGVKQSAGQFIRTHQSVLRYGIVGISTVATDAGLLFVLVHLGVQVYLAATISFWTSLLVNFTLSKLWTFGVRKNTPHQLFLYTILICWNYVYGLLMIDLASQLHLGYMFGKLSALVVTTGWNFFLYKFVIFVERPNVLLRRLQRLNNSELKEPAGDNS